jgi:copper chaperone NosL
MKRFLLFFTAVLTVSCSVAASLCRAQSDIHNYPSCPLCGMHRHEFAQSRMLLQYDDGSALGTCSIHCAAMELVLNRIKIVMEFSAADYNTKKLIDAKKASWVIGGSRAGVMTSRAKWAFEKRSEAEGFARKYGGKISAFDDVMKATFQDMYEDIKLIRQKRVRHSATMQDIKDHPECKYCGMKRELFAFSRMLIRYSNEPAIGTCSIHCSSIDLALNTDKMPEAILVGDYNTKRLIDAEKAVWVIGGKKGGIMSIRGKWAFENRKDADAFIRENGGHISFFDEAMKATFEDIDEMLR